MMALTENGHDAPIEIFDIGAGREAPVLPSTVSEEVVISAPSIGFESRSVAAKSLAQAQRAAFSAHSHIT